MSEYEKVIANLRLSYSRKKAKQRNQTEKEAWKIVVRQQFLEVLQKEGKSRLLEIGAGSGANSLFFQDNGLVEDTAWHFQAILLRRSKDA